MSEGGESGAEATAHGGGASPAAEVAAPAAVAVPASSKPAMKLAGVASVSSPPTQPASSGAVVLERSPVAVDPLSMFASPAGDAPPPATLPPAAAPTHAMHPAVARVGGGGVSATPPPALPARRRVASTRPASARPTQTGTRTPSSAPQSARFPRATLQQAQASSPPVSPARRATRSAAIPVAGGGPGSGSGGVATATGGSPASLRAPPPPPVTVAARVAAFLAGKPLVADVAPGAGGGIVPAGDGGTPTAGVAPPGLAYVDAASVEGVRALASAGAWRDIVDRVPQQHGHVPGLDTASFLTLKLWRMYALMMLRRFDHAHAEIRKLDAGTLAHAPVQLRLLVACMPYASGKSSASVTQLTALHVSLCKELQTRPSPHTACTSASSDSTGKDAASDDNGNGDADAGDGGATGAGAGAGVGAGAGAGDDAIAGSIAAATWLDLWRWRACVLVSLCGVFLHTSHHAAAVAMLATELEELERQITSSECPTSVGAGDGSDEGDDGDETSRACDVTRTIISIQADLLSLLGRVYLHAGDVAQAKLCFDAAAHSSPQPDNPTVHTNMGLLELSVCNLESAQAHFAAAAPTAIASDTDSQQCSNATVQRVVSMNNVAVCKMQSGNADGARVTLEALLREAPGVATMHPTVTRNVVAAYRTLPPSHSASAIAAAAGVADSDGQTGATALARQVAAAVAAEFHH